MDYSSQLDQIIVNQLTIIDFFSDFNLFFGFVIGSLIGVVFWLVAKGVT